MSASVGNSVSPSPPNDSSHNGIAGSTKELSTSTTVPPSYSLLSLLPPELRNEIYELVLTGPDNNHQALFAAEPPSGSMLLTCREINKEIAAMYKQAHKIYWSTSIFMGGQPTKTEALTALGALREGDIRHVRRIELYEASVKAHDVMHDEGDPVEFRDGLWTLNKDRSQQIPGSTTYVILPGKGKRTSEEDLLLSPMSNRIREYKPDDSDDSWAFVETTYPTTQTVKVAVQALEAYVERRNLSLWELEGAMRYTLPWC